jgi:hypothetical protein
LVSMSSYTIHADNTQEWMKMIQGVRSRFNGFLTYSANWGDDAFATEVTHIGFWSSLDYVGVSAYYYLAKRQVKPSVDQFINAWSSWEKSHVKPLYDKYQKPILFTEIGFRSVEGAHNATFDWGMQGPFDEEEQSRLYEAFFKFWNDKSYFNGVYFWVWNTNPSQSGPGNTDYTPYGKKAEKVLAQWFGGTASNPGTPNPNPNPQPQPGSWNITGTASVNKVGSPATISVKVAAGQTVGNSLVDVEIYNAEDKKIAQQVFTDQDLTQGGIKTVTMNWTPSAAGKYTVKAGVFTTDWSKNYTWDSNVVSFIVRQS